MASPPRKGPQALDVEVESQPLALSPQSSGQLSAPAPQKTWQPPARKALLWGGAALLAVLALAVGLGVGLGDGSGSASSGGVQSGAPASCADLAGGPFWEWAVPRRYALALNLTEAHFGYVAAGAGAGTSAGGGFGLGGAPAEFAASSTAEFEVLRPTRCLVLHARNLTFTRLAVRAGGGGAPAVELCAGAAACARAAAPVSPRARAAATSMDTDLVAIDLGGLVLAPGGPRATLEAAYTGRLGAGGAAPHGQHGLHYSAPFPVCGAAGGGCAAQRLVVTQLEPTHARALLPVVDAPAAKAVFDVAVTAPAGVVVLSNAAEARRAELGDGSTVRFEFEPTPVMSAYLLAVAAGRLAQLDAGAGGAGGGGAPRVRAWAVPGREAGMALAARTAAVALPYYADYFGVAQPLATFDVVAVPGKSGAMENWGLLLFDEERALVFEDGAAEGGGQAERRAANSSAAAAAPAAPPGAYDAWRAVDVVCHEAAHQWAGNLFTCPSFRELFVNEGLASVLEYGCAAAAAPALAPAPLAFRAPSPSGGAPGAHEGYMAPGLRAGADPLAPPLVPGSDLSPPPLRSAVDYSKGAGVFRMLQDYLNTAQPGLFRDGLRRAAAARAYSTFGWADVVADLGAATAASPGFATDLAKQVAVARFSAYVDAGTEAARLELAHVRGKGGIAAWAHAPLLPVVRPGVLLPDAAGARTVPAVVPSNYTQTVTNLIATQAMFCAWTLGAERAAAFGLRPQADAVAAACGSPDWFALPLLLDNFTDCALASPSGAALAPTIESDYGPPQYADDVAYNARGRLYANGWVANHEGSRMYRTQLGEAHLATLLAVAAGARLCGSAGGDVVADPAAGEGACCADAGDVLEAAALASDAVALALAGAYPAPWALRALEATAAAPMAAGGLGLHLLAAPAAGFLAELRPVAEAGGCAAAADAFAAELLAPHAARALRALGEGGALPPFDAARDLATPGGGALDMLQRLAGAEVAWAAAAAGDANTTAALCALLPGAPLWGLVASAPAPNASAAGAAPPDLLPAVYAVAAAQPDACAAAAGGGVDSGALVDALARCWWEAPSWAEAGRCAGALPHAAAAGGWPALPALLAGAEARAGEGLAAALRRLDRREALKRRLPALVGAAARRSGGWAAALGALDAHVAPFAGASAACDALDEMPPAPPAGGDRAALEEHLRRGGGAACAPETRARALGRADTLAAVAAAEGGAAAACAWLAGRGGGR